MSCVYLLKDGSPCPGELIDKYACAWHRAWAQLLRDDRYRYELDAPSPEEARAQGLLKMQARLAL